MNERHDATAGLFYGSFDTSELELVDPELAEAAKVLNTVELDFVPALEHEAADLGAGCAGSGKPEGRGQFQRSVTRQRR